MVLNLAACSTKSGSSDNVSEETEVVDSGEPEVVVSPDSDQLSLFWYDEDGELQLISSCDEGDLLYDDIGSELLIKKMRSTKQELFESLEKFYAAFVAGK